ncbi:hypothetical protein MKX01_039594 [Papaver californicum]|nr:hypothetical protein MKX01_039594 [Papaver californicum]
MEFIKFIDQTVREIKREVNVKILKVPAIQQKVYDATCNEPWGPHGTDLAEIAQATTEPTDCKIIMNVLWTRLADNGSNWRHVYKALVVIEYLVAHGSETAVYDIIDHSFQISVLSTFVYVELNGKDMGINIRKRVDTILSLLDDKDKIQKVRDKAAADRDKYFGLSSTGNTCMSSSISNDRKHFFGSDRPGSISATKEGEMLRNSYEEKEHFGHDGLETDDHDESRSTIAGGNQGMKAKDVPAQNGRDHTASSSSTAEAFSSNCSPSQDLSATIGSEDDFDDFDPRETSTAKIAPVQADEVDLLGDFMDTPTSLPPKPCTYSASSEVDLFAHTLFVSATPYVDSGVSSQAQANVDLFASKPSSSSASSSPMIDFFASRKPVLQVKTKTLRDESINSQTGDPFSGMKLNGFDESISSHTFDPFSGKQPNSFDDSDHFDAFTFHTDQVSRKHVEMKSSMSEGCLKNQDPNTSTDSKHPLKKDPFQVTSGVWADTLNRGLIDLNITADEKDTTSTCMGKAMVSGSGSVSKSGLT